MSRLEAIGVVVCFGALFAGVVAVLLIQIFRKRPAPRWTQMEINRLNDERRQAEHEIQMQFGPVVHIPVEIARPDYGEAFRWPWRPAFDPVRGPVRESFRLFLEGGEDYRG